MKCFGCFKDTAHTYCPKCKKELFDNQKINFILGFDKKELAKIFKFTPFVREKGHSRWVKSIAITPDGKTIVSGSLDNTIKIWDIKSGENIYSIDYDYEIGIDKNGYFNGSDEAIENYIRIREAPLSQRKLTVEEIKYFRKKGDFL